MGQTTTTSLPGPQWPHRGSRPELEQGLQQAYFLDPTADQLVSHLIHLNQEVFCFDRFLIVLSVFSL